jgi:hypothetical protein
MSKKHDLNIDGFTKSLDDIINDSPVPIFDDPSEELEEPILIIDLDEVNDNAKHTAQIITERLSNYYFDEKYIKQHPYIPSKIQQEMDNIRRLLKMLTINEKAQDALIKSIAINSGKGSLYGSLTALQNSMLSIQTQLNNLTTDLETIFSTMQAECEKTFEEKDHEIADDGSVTVRGSREFIKQLNMQNKKSA